MATSKVILLRKILLTLMVALGLLLGYLECEHYYNYGHLFSYGLHVDAISEYADIGIPGQTHMYNARLFNFTLLPVSLIACDYVSDTMTPGTEYPYAVQRWDASSNSWQTVAEIRGEGFCHPVPLSTIETHLVSKLLWPGMSVEVMGGEATGARKGFRKGDLARFVVFRRLNKEADWQSAVPSVPFYIQDQVIRSEDDSYRIKH